MPRSILQELATGGASRDEWLIAVEAIVADVGDEERAHQIRVIIPTIDENIVHDYWIRALVPFVGPDGYGSFHSPALGSEVILFGRLGEHHTLYYISVFNEDFRTPPEMSAAIRGVKVDSQYKLLADALIEIISQTVVHVLATNQVDVGAAVVRLLGGSSEVVRVEPGKLGFHTKAAIPPGTLAPSATNLPTVIALANSIRDFLIERGDAQ